MAKAYASPESTKEIKNPIFTSDKTQNPKPGRILVKETADGKPVKFFMRDGGGHTVRHIIHRLYEAYKVTDAYDLIEVEDTDSAVAAKLTKAYKGKTLKYKEEINGRYVNTFIVFDDEEEGSEEVNAIASLAE